MIVFPNAKINIGLNITGKRSDGYHNIETVFYPVMLSDALEFVVSDQSAEIDVLKVTGIDTGSEPEDNLVLKAVKRLHEKYSFPFLKIHLHKAIPAGAGLGGGSSDAAFIIRSVIRYFGLSIDNDNMKALAIQIGSDCPFFIDDVPSLATGRGEILTPVSQVLSDYYLVIANPGVGISTREAYRNCLPEAPSAKLEQLIVHPVIEWKSLITNDFEDYAFKKHPVIGDIKEGLYGCNALFSLMSGSGSSVYGIFQMKPELPEKLRDFVIWEGKI
jgi:4-diphosphocytidyl-2-C-methyl-D-erythritol kinase